MKRISYWSEKNCSYCGGLYTVVVKRQMTCSKDCREAFFKYNKIFWKAATASKKKFGTNNLTKEK